MMAGLTIVSASSIAGAISLAVANLANPTELNSRAGGAGQEVLCYQIAAGSTDNATRYVWDAAGSAANSPYVLAASGSGYWYAIAGRYVNSAVSLASTLAVTGAATMSSTLAVTADITTGANAALGTGFFASNNAAGSTSDVRLQSAGLNRWIIRKDSTAEGGSNAGSNFAIVARDDAGSTIDTPLAINRVAGGAIALARPVTMSSTLGVTGVLTASTRIDLDGAAGTTRDFIIKSSGTNRWIVRGSSGAEAGSNAGTAFQLIARDDAGSQIDIPIDITRAAAGPIAFARPTTIAHSVAGSNLLTLTQGTLPSTAVQVNTNNGTGASTVSALSLILGNSITSQTTAGVLDVIMGAIEASTDILARFRSNGTNKVMVYGNGAIAGLSGMSVGTLTASSAGVLTVSRSANPSVVLQTSGVTDGQLRVTATNTVAIADSGGNAVLGVNTGTGAAALTGTMTVSGRSSVAASGLSTFGMLVVGEGGTNPLTGTTQQGVRSIVTSTTAATAGTHGLVASASTGAGAYTCGFVTGGYFQFGSVGAGSTVTRASGILVERATAGTNQAGLVIIDGGGSPAWTGTYALRSESAQTSAFSGSLLVGTATDDAANRLQVVGATAGAGALIRSTAGATRLTIDDGTGGGGSDRQIYLTNSVASTKTNWRLGAQININNGFEIGHSTTAGGATYTTDLAIASGGNVLLGTTTDDGSNKLQVTGDVAMGRSGGSSWFFQSPSTDLRISGQTSGAHLAILPSGTGKTLIATATDDGSGAKLQVAGGVAITTGSTTRGLTSTYAQSAAYSASTSSTWTSARIANSDLSTGIACGIDLSTAGGTAAAIVGVRETTSTSGHLAFITANSGVTAEAARFTNLGNLCVGTTSDFGTIVNITRLRVLSAGLGSSCDPLALQPNYTGAFTVARAGYINLRSPSLAGSAAVTDACVFSFDAAAGTHKALDSGTTKTTPGTVNAWMKLDVNGTVYYIPAYTSKTT